MRILASNPDTIGDVILRQPLYRALLDAGHELALVVRPLLAPLAPLVAPGARVLTVASNVYEHGLAPGSESLASVASGAQEFDPDVFLVAPFQWTVLEERLAVALPRARRVAMTGRLFGDPRRGSAPPTSIAPHERVEVAEDIPEIRKNEALAGAVLGRAVRLPDPRIEPTEAQRRAGEAELARLGLAPGSYWAACVGSTEHTAVRNWAVERWAAVLATWAKEFDRRFLLIGHSGELETAQRVREAMGEAGARAEEWFGEGNGSLDVLVGLLAHARGYVGRDTGPMHLAAALELPVLAVFGGGTWPRFLPATDRSVSISVGVPCAGCGWICHLQDSYCIKEVPTGEVLEAARALERGEVSERRVRLLTPDPSLLARVGREGGVYARNAMARLAIHGRAIAPADAGPDAGGLADVPVGLRDVADRRSGTIALADVRRLQDELASARRQLGEARARITQLETESVARLRARHQQAALLSAAREMAAELRGRVDSLERRLEQKSQEAMTARAELSVARHQARNAAGERQELEGLRAQVERARAEAEAMAQRAEAAESHLADAAEARQRAQAAEARLRVVAAEQEARVAALGQESAEREATLRQQLAHARTAQARVEAALKDLRLRIQRAQSDQVALNTLSRQQESEIVVLRERLRDLMASRWRKMGQRLHLAMTLPWEREAHENGHA